MRFYLINSIVWVIALTGMRAFGGPADCITAPSANPKTTFANSERMARALCGPLPKGESFSTKNIEKLVLNWKTQPKPFRKDGATGDPYLESRTQLEQNLYKALAIPDDTAEDKANYVSAESLVQRANKIREELKTLISDEPNLSESTKLKMIESLDRTQVVTLETAKQIKNDTDRASAVTFYKQTCGDALEQKVAKTRMRHNFFQKSEIESLIAICPLAITTAPRGVDRLEALNQIIAHEFAHAATVNGRLASNEKANENYELAYLPLISRQAHKNYLTCIEKNYANEFNSYEDLKKTAKANIRSEDLDKSFEGFHILNKIERFERVVPYTPSQTESHARELVADFWAARWIASKLKTDDPKSVRRRLKSFLGIFCTDSNSINHGDGGEHPNHNFRIAETLRNPEIRALIEKSNPKIKIEGVSCDLSPALEK